MRERPCANGIIVLRVLRCERARMCEKLTHPVGAGGGVGAIERVRMIEWLRRAQLVYDPSGSLSCRHPHKRRRCTEYINLFAARPTIPSFTHPRAHGHKTDRESAHAAALGCVERKRKKKKILRVTQILTHAFSYAFVNSYLYPRRRLPFPEPALRSNWRRWRRLWI